MQKQAALKTRPIQPSSLLLAIKMYSDDGVYKYAKNMIPILSRMINDKQFGNQNFKDYVRLNAFIREYEKERDIVPAKGVVQPQGRQAMGNRLDMFMMQDDY